MKIAICFSGQIRTGVETAPNILRYIGDLLPNCDFFIHTWDVESYSSIGFSSKLTDYKNIHPGETYKIDKQKYKDFINIYCPVISMLDDFLLWSASNKVLPHQYSVYRSNKLKSMYEEMNKFTYDIVIRIRPDIIFDSTKSLKDDILSIKDNRTLCYAQLYDEQIVDNNIHNGYWMGSSYVLDQVTNFYNVMLNMNVGNYGRVDEHIHFGNWITFGLLFNTVKLSNSKVAIYRQFHKEREASSSDYEKITETIDRRHPE